MTTALLTLLLLSADTAGAAGPARSALDALLPADAGLVILVDDLGRARASWPASALGRTWNAPAVKRFLAPLRAKMEIDRWEEKVKGKVGYTLKELLDSFRGPAALAALLEPRGEGPPEFRGVLIATIDPHRREVVEAWLTRGAEPAKGTRVERATRDVEGETLHVERQVSEARVEEEWWSIVDGHLIRGTHESLVKDVIAGVKKGGIARPLSADGGFRNMRERTGGADVVFYLNARSFLPMFTDHLKASMGKDGAAQAMGVTPEGFVQAFGFDALNGFYAASRADADATQVDVGVLYDGEKGLLKALAYRPGPVRLPDFIPDDVFAAAASNFSLAGAWEGFKSVLQGMNPMATGMFQMQLQQLKQDAGIDIEGRLLPSLGDRLITATFRPASAPGAPISMASAASVYGLSVSDRQTLELALEAIKKLAGGELFEAQPYLDDTIYTLKVKLPAPPDGETPPPTFAYVLTDDFLFLSGGGPEPLRTLLAGRRQPRRSIWARDDVKRALATLPEGACELSYANAAAMFVAFFEGIAAGQAVASEGREPLCDVEAKPDLASLEAHVGLAVGAGYKDGHGFFATYRILPPAP